MALADFPDEMFGPVETIPLDDPRMADDDDGDLMPIEEMFARYGKPDDPSVEAEFRRLHAERSKEREDKRAFDVFNLGWDEVIAIAEGPGTDKRSEMARARCALGGPAHARPFKSGKRGRPKAWHRPLQLLQGGTVGGESDRTLQNRAIASHAKSILINNWEPDFAWFWKSAPCASHEEMLHALLAANRYRTLDRTLGGARQTVLIELGRLGDDEEVLAVARKLATWPLKTSTAEAVRALRRARVGATSRKKNLRSAFAAVADRLHEDGASWEAITNALEEVETITYNLGLRDERGEAAAIQETVSENPTTQALDSEEEESEPVSENPVDRVRVDVSTDVRFRVGRGDADPEEADDDATDVDAEPLRMVRGAAE